MTRRHLLSRALPGWAVIRRVQFVRTILRAGAGAFVLAGQAVTFSLSLGGMADAGAFTLTGQAARLLKATKMAAAAAAFSVSGQAVALVRRYPLIASAGTFSLAGQAAALKRSTKVLAAAGTFTLTGIAAILRKGINMLAAGGTFTLSGQGVATRATRKVAAAAGTFSLAGQAAALKSAKRVTAGASSFSVTGQAVTLTYVTAGGNDAFTKLLLHCDGSDGSTTFTDSSASAHTITANGNGQVDTAQSVFGGASYLGDGAGDSLTVPDSADWNFGSGDFAIDFRVRYAAVSIAGLVGQYANASNYWVMYRTGGGTLRLIAVSGGATAIDISFSWSPSTNTWYHVALSRSGNNFRAYIDGTQIGTTQVSAAAMPDIAGSLYVASHPETASLNGHVDEVRISKGTDRGWTGATITVPIVAYS